MSGYKRYPAYKESGVEWIGEIPAGWSHKMLKFVGNAVLGKMLTNDDKGAYSLKPYLRAKNILWERVDADDINEMWFSAREMEQFRVRTNDLLISEGGEVGRTAIWNDELEECYLQNSVHKFTVGKGEEPRFHLYQLVTLGKLGYFDSVVNKVSIGHLTGEKLGPIPLVTPPPSEQTKIAAFLDRKTAQIDRLIEIKCRQIKMLKEERTAVINHAVTKGLHPGVKMKESGIEWIGEIPEEWQAKRLKLVMTDMVSGPFGSALKKEEYTSDGYRVYGQEQVIPNDFTVGDYYISEEKFKSLERYAVSPGDVLVSCVGTFGKIAVVPEDIEPGVINPRLIRLAPDKNQITPLYLEQLLSSSFVFSQFEQVSRGGTMGVINLGLLSELLLPIPPIEEQPVLLEKIEEINQKNSKAIALQEQQIQLLQEYRTTLISDAVTGKIDVREEAA